MPYFPTKSNDTIRVSGTYTPSGDDDQSLPAGLTGDGTTTTGLNVIRRHPVGCEPRAPRPCIISFGGGGFSAMNVNAGLTNMNEMVTRGFVIASPKYRTEVSNPFSDIDSSSDSDKTKAIRAAIDDARRAVNWVFNNRITDDYVIDHRGVFIFGSSAGAMLGMMYCMDNPNHQIAGLINCRGGFGLDGLSVQDTTDLRAFYDESDWPQSPPVLAFLGGSDTTIGGTYNDDLETQLDLDVVNTTYFLEAEGHTNITATPPIYGRSAPYDDISTFCNTEWSALPQRGSKLNIA